MTKELTLEDLASFTGLSLRTLRFYIQEGILPGPDTHGKNARYSRQHLERLELIRRFKDLRLPLQEIGQLLNNMTPAEIAQMCQYQNVLHHTLEEPAHLVNRAATPSAPVTSALDYIRSLERGRSSLQQYSDLADKNMLISESPSYLPGEGQKKGKAQAQVDQEAWTRITITDGLEIHVKKSDGINDRAKISKLVAYAHNLYQLDHKKGEK